MDNCIVNYIMKNCIEFKTGSSITNNPVIDKVKTKINLENYLSNSIRELSSDITGSFIYLITELIKEDDGLEIVRKASYYPQFIYPNLFGVTTYDLKFKNTISWEQLYYNFCNMIEKKKLNKYRDRMCSFQNGLLTNSENKTIEEIYEHSKTTKEVFSVDPNLNVFNYETGNCIFKKEITITKRNMFILNRIGVN